LKMPYPDPLRALPPLTENDTSLVARQLPLVVILGPTAVGKTTLSIQLAARLNGEIVSADSRLFYRGMDIGTAKPSLEERQKVPHHLIDVSTPDQPWSLALFQQKAHQLIQEISSRGRLPFLVGGTGQYIHAVTKGWNPPQVPPDPQLRKVLENWVLDISPLGLHARLVTLDPGAANRIDPQNLRRTIRALEVIFHTGQRFSDQNQQTPSPYRLLQIGLILPRPMLYARIDDRIDTMLHLGFVAEVQGLLDQGYPPDLSPFSAIGYREIIAYLQGKTTMEEAILLMKRQSRVFVRRQANWFKETDPQIHWFDAQNSDVETVIDMIHRWNQP
jgi:tRNA dimethylallyltransferase